MKNLSMPHEISTNGSAARAESLGKANRPTIRSNDRSAIKQIESLSKKLADTQMLADSRLQEIIILSKLVVELRGAPQDSAQVSNIKKKNPRRKRFWGIPFHFSNKGTSAIKGDLAAIRACPLFDQAWYLEKYPDVQKSGLDPALHYLKFGAKEGRNPGPTFDTLEYLKKNSMLEGSGENPLLHHIKTNG